RTPPRTSAVSFSICMRRPRPKPCCRRARSRARRSKSTRSPAGSPVRIAVRPGPWLSPPVVRWSRRMAARIAGGSGSQAAPSESFFDRSRRDRLSPLMSIQDTPSAWSPILSPEAAESPLRVVDEIADDLRAAADQPLPQEQTWLRRGPSLAGGDAGLACFFTYLDAVRPGRGYDDLAMQLLERAIEGTGVMQAPPGLYSGFSGVAWTLEHLRGRLYEDDAEEDPGEEVASALVEHLGLTPWRGQYDLISGLVGFGVYALERLPRPGGRESLERTVARLGEIAERPAAGQVTWRTGPELLIDRELVNFPDGNFNLGVAHGVPGVIGVLARACAAGVDGRELLDGAVAWLLAQKLPPEESAAFSYNIAPGVEPRAPRLAWCYGDLGIAASLLMAARAVGEASWE